MIGSLNGIENITNALNVGVTSIGNLAQYFTYEYPGLDEYLTSEERLNRRKQDIENAKAALIKEALDITNGNKAKAAKLLGCSRSSFYRFMETYLK